MAVKIRLKRMGAKRAPYYRIVVADSATKRDGKCLDEIGTYKPFGEKAVSLDKEKAQKWVGVGATPTETVKGILKKEGVL